MAEFTETQGRYLSYVHTYTTGFGMPPSDAEVGEAFGVSSASVCQMMKTLEKKGFIERQKGVSRSTKVLVNADLIPKWKGKRITRTVWEWVYVGPKVAPQVEQTPKSESVYRFKVTLLKTSPAIWRRIETTDVSLGQLHELIQTAMGWKNSHLHQFEVAGVRYTDPRLIDDDPESRDHNKIRIADLVAEQGEKLKMMYEYDFGDGWMHELELEAVSQPTPGTKYPLCVDGARACPPENVGGVYGFADFVDAITDSTHPEHKEWRESYGRFDPVAFDSNQATRRMKRGLPKW